MTAKLNFIFINSYLTVFQRFELSHVTVTFHGRNSITTKCIARYIGKVVANPLSKIHKQGVKYLEAIGWKKLDYKLNENIIPNFL